MITDIAILPFAATAVVLYVVVGGTFLITHNLLVSPIVYLATGKSVSSHKDIKKFYSTKKKVVPE